MDKETLELAKQIYIANCASGMEPGKAIKKAKAFLRTAKSEWQIKPLDAPEEADQDRGASNIDPGVPGASGVVCEPKGRIWDGGYGKGY